MDVRPAEIHFTFELVSGTSAGEDKADPGLAADPALKDLRKLMGLQELRPDRREHRPGERKGVGPDHHGTIGRVRPRSQAPLHQGRKGRADPDRDPFRLRLEQPAPSAARRERPDAQAGREDGRRRVQAPRSVPGRNRAGPRADPADFGDADQVISKDEYPIAMKKLSLPFIYPRIA